MALISYLGDSIRFEAVANPIFRNVLCFGNIGDGKSCLLNKINFVSSENASEMEQVFVSAKSLESVTIGLKQKTIGKIRMIDT